MRLSLMKAGTMLADMKAYAAAFILGVLLWTLATIALGGREPWDSNVYWTMAYPAALILCGGLGALFPARPWRWPLVLMGAQLPVMTVSGSDLGLWPLTLGLLAILSLPGMAAASLAAWLIQRPK
jgi:hypothetical protein